MAFEGSSRYIQSELKSNLNIDVIQSIDLFNALVEYGTNYNLVEKSGKSTRKYGDNTLATRKYSINLSKLSAIGLSFLLSQIPGATFISTIKELWDVKETIKLLSDEQTSIICLLQDLKNEGKIKVCTI